MTRSGRPLAGDRDTTHSALTNLYEPGNALAKPPTELKIFFDDGRIADLAQTYRQKQSGVRTGGRAVVISAGPPGAGKTAALDSLQLKGYRRIDPDEAKDLVLRAASMEGLLEYRNQHLLPDGKPVGLRELAPHIHEYSNRVTDLVRAAALTAGENVIIDGTLSWEPLVGQYIDELDRAGYEGLEVVAVEAPLEVALIRAKQRWWHGRLHETLGGRFISEQVIRALYTTAQQSVCESNARLLAERAGDELGRGQLNRFDVSDPEGRPQLTARTTFE